VITLRHLHLGAIIESEGRETKSVAKGDSLILYKAWFVIYPNIVKS
jgi:hypothetical protein